MSLPTDPKARKDAPIYSGVIKYFPDAIAALAITRATCDPPLNARASLNALAALLRSAGGRDERGARVSAVIARHALIALESELDPGRDRHHPPPHPGVHSAVLAAFPRALAAIAELSRVGNEQHNPGKPLHWDRSKSSDELDALTRHLVEAGTTDTDGVRHTTKVAWRALANLQKEIERDVALAAEIAAAARVENEARVSLANRPRVFAGVDHVLWTREPEPPPPAFYDALSKVLDEHPKIRLDPEHTAHDLGEFARALRERGWSAGMAFDADACAVLINPRSVTRVHPAHVYGARVDDVRDPRHRSPCGCTRSCDCGS